MAEVQSKETHGFQTEVRKLLDLMIHSLYSNKEIFLRELISNASDAADKLRFEALSDDALYEGDGELGVRISFDADSRTVSVRDNGIGMTREEIASNLGTIARSGTRQFFEALTGDAAKDTQLIGQFGVGFYSSFIVADRVVVTSRRAGRPASEGVRWESSGEGEFTVETADVEPRGTEVVLHLRDGEDEFLDRWRLRNIVRKYSDHVSIPILMPGEGKADAEADDDDADSNTGEVETKDEETINAATALWTRNKSELGDDDYNGFYKHVAHDFEDPLAWIHSRVEGTLEYSLLLFIPARAPFDLWDRNVRRGVKLYVRRIFIMDDAEHLMPAYLRFVRGVIDSADLPLNISREILQENRRIQSIRTGAVKRVLDLLGGMAKDDSEKYAKFWEHFGRVLKEGVVEDGRNREQVAKLLRFASTHGADDAQSVSLDDYVSRMKEGQKGIYYITADSYRTARHSPHLEVFDKHGLEVLLLADPIDEWLVMHLTEYEDKPLVSVMKGELDLGEIASGDDAPKEEADGDHAPVLERFREALSGRIKDVRVTRRLSTSPACLVSEEFEMSRHLERILDAAGQSVDSARPILEINPDHPMVTRLAAETEASRQTDWAHLIFDQALLSEGGRLEDAAAFVRRMNTLIVDLAEGAGPAPTRRRPAKKTATKKTTTKKAATKKTAGAGRKTAGASNPPAGEETAPDSAEQSPTRD
ncbi:MAG: molecular chaperone HtpG [Thiotrichales bacterium]|nr:molecular chaperone HtpG [Thiotrichales bacterium]MCY4348419.1 molecular chaperone HtpG [Thiotrichales bacterium]